MVNLLAALHFGRIVREILVDREREVERAALVHPLVWLDRQREVLDVVRVREGHGHCAWEREFREVWTVQ